MPKRNSFKVKKENFLPIAKESGLTPDDCFLFEFPQVTIVNIHEDYKAADFLNAANKLGLEISKATSSTLFNTIIEADGENN